jgi:hypothetical protein
MKTALEALMFVVAVMAPVAIMGFAAWLIYEQRNGWGWYLFVAFLLVGSMKMNFQGFK